MRPGRGLGVIWPLSNDPITWQHRFYDILILKLLVGQYLTKTKRFFFFFNIIHKIMKNRITKYLNANIGAFVQQDQDQ